MTRRRHGQRRATSPDIEQPRRWWVGLAIGIGVTTTVAACSDPPAETSEQGEVAAEPATPATTPDQGGGPELLPVEEASVQLVEPGEGSPVALPQRAPGKLQRVVIEVKLTEGARKRLRLPIARLAGDVMLEAVDNGSRYLWTPHATTILEGEGVEEPLLTALQAALAPGDPPAAAPLVTDRFDVVTELGWPAPLDDPHASEIVAGQRLALSHLALPLPSLSLTTGARWEIRRRLDLFGLPVWQTLLCEAEKIEMPQLQVECQASYHQVAEPAITGNPLGLPTLALVDGKGKLRGRYDVATGMPVDVQLLGRFEARATHEGDVRRFGFEVRADEDFLARPDSRVTLSGEVTQGGLVLGKIAPGTTVWFNKKKIAVSADGDFLIGFGRDAPPRALLAFAFGEGPTERHVLHVADRTFEPEEIDGLPQEMVDLDRKTRTALARSRTKISRLRNKVSELTYFKDGFSWPTKGTITSTYGRKRILNGEDHGFHWGVDLAAPVGKKVRAPAGGVVVLAEQDVPLSGNLLILDHGQGLTSSFLHLDKFKVKEGDEVKAGQVIATVGNTGRSTGPHLDWRMNLTDTRIDPQLLVEGEP